MKKLLTYLGIGITTVLVIALISVKLRTEAPQSNPKSEPSIVAKLLDRDAKIQLGKEWEFVQNTYQKNKLIVNSDPQAYKEMLTLAELFIKEARVTGEHGHYYQAALRLSNNVIDKTTNPGVKYHALVIKAGVQLSHHEFQEALETGKKALALNNTSARIHGVMVDCYVELGQYANAVAMADKMVSIKPDIRSYSRISYIRELYGEYESAMKAMEMAVKAGYPGYEETAWARLTYGNLCAKMGDLDQAHKIYDQILAIRENYPFAIAAKADIAYKKGNLDKAELLLNESIEVIPEVHFYIQLAQIYKDQNRKNEFDEIIDEIFVMLEEDVTSGHNMNLAYAHIYLNLLDDYGKAMKYAKIEWDKRPKNVTVNRLMAKIALKLDENQDAKRYMAVAASLDPKHPELIGMEALL